MGDIADGREGERERKKNKTNKTAGDWLAKMMQTF